MEIQKIVNLLNDTNNKSSKFATRKWFVINDQNNTEYGEEMKMVQPLSLKQKLLNHFCGLLRCLCACNKKYNCYRWQ